jgi:hypothetical protein
MSQAREGGYPLVLLANIVCVTSAGKRIGPIATSVPGPESVPQAFRRGEFTLYLYAEFLSTQAVRG